MVERGRIEAGEVKEGFEEVKGEGRIEVVGLRLVDMAELVQSDDFGAT